MSTEAETAQPESHPVVPDPNDPWVRYLAWLFAYDVLQIRQKIVSIAEKYFVTDETGTPRFFVVRPPKLLLNILLRLMITAVRILILILVIRMIMQTNDMIAGLAVLFVTNLMLGIGAVLMSPYRDIEVYPDDSQSWRILLITQDNKLGLYRRYTLFDCFGNEVARFRRSTLWSFVRITWYVETPSGELMMRVREDSWMRALLRRYIGTLYGILRTNFNFEFPGGGVAGQYDRKLTLTDQYVLDLRGDPERLIDRRAALAMSILLDTGEMR